MTRPIIESLIGKLQKVKEFAVRKKFDKVNGKEYTTVQFEDEGAAGDVFFDLEEALKPFGLFLANIEEAEEWGTPCFVISRVKMNAADMKQIVKEIGPGPGLDDDEE